MLITLFRHLRAVDQRFPNLLGVFGQCIDPVILMYRGISNAANAVAQLV